MTRYGPILIRQAGRPDSFLLPGGRGAAASRPISLLNFTHGLLERDAVLRPRFGLVKGSNVVKFVKFLDNLRPFRKRQQNRLPILLGVDHVFWMHSHHLSPPCK